MSFDLSNVLNQANQVNSSSSSSSNEGGLRVIYPGVGTLKVRLLYNPKSNLVTRQFRRHKIGDKNYTCLQTYGQDCPMCKAVDNIKNKTGVDNWKNRSFIRGISYAQYVGSQNYSWDTNNKEPQVGELVILMYPWTIYQDINRLIATAGPKADTMISLNEGVVLAISRWMEGSQVKYRCEVDAFSPAFKSKSSDEEFDKFLNELPDLNEAIVPSTITQEIIKSAQDAGQMLSRDIMTSNQTSTMPTGSNNALGGNVSNQIVADSNGNQFVMINGQYYPLAQQPSTMPNIPSAQPPLVQVPSEQFPPFNIKGTNQPQVAPTAAATESQAPANTPECFTHYGSIEDPRKCMLCPFEWKCKESTKTA